MTVLMGSGRLAESGEFRPSIRTLYPLDEILPKEPIRGLPARLLIGDFRLRQPFLESVDSRLSHAGAPQVKFLE